MRVSNLVVLTNSTFLTSLGLRFSQITREQAVLVCSSFSTLIPPKFPVFSVNSHVCRSRIYSSQAAKWARSFSPSFCPQTLLRSKVSLFSHLTIYWQPSSSYIPKVLSSAFTFSRRMVLRRCIQFSWNNVTSTILTLQRAARRCSVCSSKPRSSGACLLLAAARVLKQMPLLKAHSNHFTRCQTVVRRVIKKVFYTSPVTKWLFLSTSMLWSEWTSYKYPSDIFTPDAIRWLSKWLRLAQSSPMLVPDSGISSVIWSSSLTFSLRWKVSSILSSPLDVLAPVQVAPSSSYHIFDHSAEYHCFHPHRSHTNLVPCSSWHWHPLGNRTTTYLTHN